MVLGVALLAGCAAHDAWREKLTSGEIGCPPSEINIADSDRNLTTITWTAQCRGETFYCTASNAGRTTCAKALAAR